MCIYERQESYRMIWIMANSGEIAEFIDRPVEDIKKILSVSSTVDSLDGLYEDSSRPILETFSHLSNMAAQKFVKIKLLKV